MRSEADGDFDVVPDEKIAEWREKLNQRFGIGSGRLTVVDDPACGGQNDIKEQKANG